MNIKELISKINTYRGKLGLSKVDLTDRPSVFSKNKRTFIVVTTDERREELVKSISMGAIHFFLRGMLTAFLNNAAPVVTISAPGKSRRMIEL